MSGSVLCGAREGGTREREGEREEEGRGREGGRGRRERGSEGVRER